MKKQFSLCFILVIFFLQVKSQCVPNAGNDTSVCGNVVNLHAVQNGCTGYWTGPAGILFLPSDTALNVSIIVPPFTNSHDTAFYWHQNNNSDQVIVHFNPFAGLSTVNAGFNRYVCGDTAYVHGIIQGVGGLTGQWSTQSSYTSINNAALANTYVQIQSDFIDFGSSSKYNVIMMFTASSGSCSSVDTMIITYYQKPKANAGLDNAFCGSAGTFNASLSITASAGQWTLLNYLGSGTGCMNPVYANQTNPNSSIQVNCYGVYFFQWREYNINSTLCSTNDTVKIEFIQIPNFSAGLDRWVCGDTVHLHAIPSNSSDGFSWLQAPVSWYNNYPFTTPADTSGAQQNPNAIVQHFSAVVNYDLDFIWQEWNVPSIIISNNPNLQCFRNDTVVVHFFGNSPAISLVDTTWGTMQCGNIYTGLNAQFPPAGQGFWLDLQGTTDFHPSHNSLQVDSAIVANYGLHHFYWIVKNGTKPDGSAVCIDTSDVIPIRFFQRPIANAGGIIWANNPDTNSVLKWDTICGNQYLLHPILSGSGIGNWVALQYPNNNFTSPGSFGNTTNAYDTAHTVIYNSDDPINRPYWSFVWIVNNGPYQANCNASDTLRITFARVPEASFSIGTDTSNLQVGSTVSFTNTSLYADVYEWNFGDGTLSTEQNPSHVYTTPGLYWVSVRVSSLFACTDISESVSIYIKSIIQFAGNVNLANGVLLDNSANAELYSVNSLIPDFVVPVTNMHFYFTGLIPGHYILKINIINDTIQNVFSTYYNHVLKWIEADTLHLVADSSYSLNVVMREAIQAQGSHIGVVSGKIVYGVGSGSKGIHKNVGDKSILGEPVPGAEIFVELEPDDEPIASGTTDINGLYQITGLPAGHSYRLIIDIPGFALISSFDSIGISSSNSNFSNMNFIVDTTANHEGIYINSIENENVKLNCDFIKIFPNPAKDRIEISGSKNGIIEIINLQGQIVKSLNYQTTKLVIDISKLSCGVYTLRIKTEMGVVVKKIIKQ